MKTLILFLILTISAHGATISRQHSDTIATGKKILASDLNDEFNNILSGVNGNLNQANLIDRGVTGPKIATASGAYIKNRKHGCELNVGADGTSVDVEVPCELYLDGERGRLLATGNVTLANIEDGSLSARFFYIYGRIANGLITLASSATEPDLDTTRKNGDTTAKYMGSVFSRDGSGTVLKFRKNGNEYMFFDSNEPAVFAKAIASGASQYEFSTPVFVTDAIMDLTGTVSSSAGVCIVLINDGESFITERMHFATGTSGRYRIGHIIPLTNTRITSTSFSGTNCDAVTLTLRGYKEPEVLHK